ncbi:MAG: hypothetical protein WBO46_03395 [Caldilineaceae bacterium]
MWDALKQQQLNRLQQRQEEGILSDEECQALESLLSELEQEEWIALRPALENLRGEQKQMGEAYAELRSRNAILAAIVERQEDLFQRVRIELAGLLHEHEVLKSAYARVGGPS